MMHETTFSASLGLIQRELSRRLEAYRSDIRAGTLTRDDANARYLALQTAAHLLGAKGQPAVTVPYDDVVAELVRWQKELQRTATYDTARAHARDIADIQVAIECVGIIHPKPLIE